MPLAVIVSRPGSTVKTERNVLGNTRLDVACPRARAAGVEAGQTVAAARARCSELRVRVVREDDVHDTLVRVAESMLAFGPVVSFDPGADVVWVDVGGCAHLHGGEEKLAHAVVAHVERQGHACRVAIAGGPRIASAVARWGSMTVVPVGEGARAMRVLPVEALGLDAGTRDWLSDLGLRTCGDLQKLPRSAFGNRLGARAYEVLQLLDGDDGAPLAPWRPAPAPEENLELEWGAHSVEGLTFVMHTLCNRLAARLEGRAMAAGRLEIHLGLDRALCEGSPAETSLSIVLPVPIATGKDLFAVVRVRLERHSLAGLPAPVLRASLRACDLVPREGIPRDLLDPEPKAERRLIPLVSELAAELGMERIGVLTLVDTWQPGERTHIAPFNAEGVCGRSGKSGSSARSFHPLETSALEPSRVLPSASGPRVSRDALVEPLLLARIEAVEWWRKNVERRDVVAAWWTGAVGWFEVRSDGDAQLRGWID